MTEKRDVLDYLTDIVAAIDAAQAFVAGMNDAQFRADQRTVYAVTHALQPMHVLKLIVIPQAYPSDLNGGYSDAARVAWCCCAPRSAALR